MLVSAFSSSTGLKSSRAPALFAASAEDRSRQELYSMKKGMLSVAIFPATRSAALSLIQ